MRVDPKQISVGMKVYGDDGHKLGKVLAVGPTSFAIERGLLLRTAYLVLYGEVMRIDDQNAAHLIRGRPEFFATRNATPRDDAKRLERPPAKKSTPKPSGQTHAMNTPSNRPTPPPSAPPPPSPPP